MGLTGGNDPDCRGAFPWDESRWDGEFRGFVRELVAPARVGACPADRATTVAAAAGGAIAIERRLGETRLVVAVNAADDPVRLELHLDGVGDGAHLERIAPGVSTVADGWSVEPEGASAIALGPRSGSVLRLA